jgi:hypothetical protein
MNMYVCMYVCMCAHTHTELSFLKGYEGKGVVA